MPWILDEQCQPVRCSSIEWTSITFKSFILPSNFSCVTLQHFLIVFLTERHNRVMQPIWLFYTPWINDWKQTYNIMQSTFDNHIAENCNCMKEMYLEIRLYCRRKCFQWMFNCLLFTHYCYTDKKCKRMKFTIKKPVKPLFSHTQHTSSRTFIW